MSLDNFARWRIKPRTLTLGPAPVEASPIDETASGTTRGESPCRLERMPMGLAFSWGNHPRIRIAGAVLVGGLGDVKPLRRKR